MQKRGFLTPAAFCLAACGPPLPEPLDRPDAGDNGSVWLDVEPGVVSETPPIVRIRVHFRSEPVDEATLRLFSGELSTYHLGRIARDDLPRTLAERIEPVLRWTETEDAGYVITFAPTRALAPGMYSVASRELGLIGTVAVADVGAPVVARLWPPAEIGVGAEHVVYCGAGSLVEDAMPVRLEPGGSAAELRRGVGPEAHLAERCTELASLEAIDGPAVVPPAFAAGVALDPAPLTIWEPPVLPDPPGCAADELRFGPGCARVLDDRIIVRSADAPLLWLLDAPAGPLLQAVPAAGRFVALGFQAGVAREVSVRTYDLAGRTKAYQALVVPGEPRPHIVLNEVFANALGPEPAQEWVELYNDGQAAVELEGWSIEDVGGVTLLGPHRLEQGSFVLVVGADYDEALDLDVQPAAGTQLLRVPRLGKSGLSNSGERLLLRDAAGNEVSRFPALPAAAGRSVARRLPHSLDDDPEAFGPHAPPGASPGAVNEL
jgi:hypothetical protein